MLVSDIDVRAQNMKPALRDSLVVRVSHSVFPPQGPWAPSLLGELGLHVLHSLAKGKKAESE